MKKLVAEKFALEIISQHSDAKKAISANSIVFGMHAANSIEEFFAASEPQKRYDLFLNEVVENDEVMKAVFQYCYSRKNSSLFANILDYIVEQSGDIEKDLLVVSSIPLSSGVLAKIKEKYNVQTITNEINPDLIAGFKIYYGSTEYDHSLLSKLVG